MESNVAVFASSRNKIPRIRGLSSVGTGQNGFTNGDPIYGTEFLLASPGLAVAILNSVIVGKPFLGWREVRRKGIVFLANLVRMVRARFTIK
jgi:hypothetical protein